MRTFVRILSLSLVLVLFIPDVYAWGQKGHDVTCEIAERHLDRGASACGTDGNAGGGSIAVRRIQSA